MQDRYTGDIGDFIKYGLLRAGGHCQEVRFWMSRLPGCTHAYYCRRWSNRTFFLVNPDEEIQRRLTIFVRRWGGHGRLLSSTT